jgi:hypothetical protein
MSSRPRSFLILVATLLLGPGLTLGAAFGADKPQTFTGKVSDSMCGAHHMMEGSAAECTRTCVKKGSKYALVVGDKVYALDTQDQATLEKLDQLADKTAKVQGTVNGDAIQVTAVATSK